MLICAIVLLILQADFCCLTISVYISFFLFFTFALAPAFKHQYNDGINCECFKELCSIIRDHLEQFKADRANCYLMDMVEAMFRCLEAMLNYEGGCVWKYFMPVYSILSATFSPHYLYTDMAREFLNGSDSVDSLIELAKSELYVSNTTIQRCVLNIVQKTRHYQKGLFTHFG